VTTGAAFDAAIARRLFEARVFVCCGWYRPQDVSPQGGLAGLDRPHVDGVLQVEVVEDWLGTVEAAVGR
jgi:hypothetical protein